MKVLIVEDEAELLTTMDVYLKSGGFLCEHAFSFSQAVQKVELYEYDCILVDLNLPDGNGLDLIKRIRNLKKTYGIIIVSARAELETRLKGLETGADDYIVKPFHLAELSARIKSVIRRVNYGGTDCVVFGEIKVLTDEHKVYVKEQLLDLTKTEYDMLLFLVSNQNRVIAKESIAEHVWGDYIDAADSFDFVYNHIKNLRKKIKTAADVDYIKTIYGIGYKLSIE
jgi:DNA-binding response OmpR family regulator